MLPHSYIANADPAALESLYQSWQADPASVAADWGRFFEGYDLAARYAEGSSPSGAAPASTDGRADKEGRVQNLIYSWRARGHLQAHTNPVRPRRDRKARLELADFGLTEADLDTSFRVGQELGLGTATLRQIVDRLKLIYEGSVGFEYLHCRDPKVLDWLQTRIEGEFPTFAPDAAHKRRILQKLNEAVVFENFLHTKFLGQKRFSLEGGETTIPALDAIIETAAELGAREVMIGMAHRGRLNVLTNILGKTYEQVFSEFQGTAIPDTTMGDGDVKYHMGYSSEVQTLSGKTVNLKLAPNPSHLEAVNPVVEGFVRAKIEHHYGDDVHQIVPILIHGDAALAGQGIVYEVTQMSLLEGYRTGGTIHFVINNQVGFTTDFADARSSIYCTDVAKIVDAPVLHVNGDDPEAVVFAVRLATAYRQEFQADIFVDMVCYRRHGHNEADEPKFTQPDLYNIIAGLPNPREVYAKRLIARGDVNAEEAAQVEREFRDLLQARLDMVKQQPLPYTYQKLENEWRALRRATPSDFDQSPQTGIPATLVDEIGQALTSLPEGFTPLKQIDNLLKERRKMFFETKVLNWAAGEALAYGSLLREGNLVRVSGQDCQRGTFSHRHAVLHDAQTNHAHTSLNHIKPGHQAELQIYNSLLSEYAVLGFEFGYAMANPTALVVWEAQFGDFANGAQTMIDQFIAASESKWQRMNGVTLLLPHGYEGQGPEHSNARPERFLQLAAEYNMVVANCTTPANFFHLLRRQLAWEFRKPLVVMSPKSMLRHPLCVSPVEEFTSGAFREVLPDTWADAKKVKRVLLCSGKIYFDLLEEQRKNERHDVAIVRLEQLHPFPGVQLDAALKAYKNPRLVWVQEEPENMGAWTYLLRFRHLLPVLTDPIARKPSASPATGYNKLHLKEQAELVARAFQTSTPETGNIKETAKVAAKAD